MVDQDFRAKTGSGDSTRRRLTFRIFTLYSIHFMIPVDYGLSRVYVFSKFPYHMKPKLKLGTFGARIQARKTKPNPL